MSDNLGSSVTYRGSKGRGMIAPKCLSVAFGAK